MRMQAQECDTATLQRSGPRRASAEDVPYLILACRASLVDQSVASDVALLDEFKSGGLEGFILDDEEGYRACIVVSMTGRTAMLNAVLRTADDPFGLYRDADKLLSFTLDVLKDRGVEKVWAHVVDKHPNADRLL